MLKCNDTILVLTAVGYQFEEQMRIHQESVLYPLFFNLQTYCSTKDLKHSIPIVYFAYGKCDFERGHLTLEDL